MLTLLPLLSSKAQVRALRSSWELDSGGRSLLSIISYKETMAYPAFLVLCSTNELPSENKVLSGFSTGISFKFSWATYVWVMIY